MDLTLSPAWAIELVSDHPAARLAAAELQSGLLARGGPELPILAAHAGPRIALRHGADGDGFVRAAAATGLTLRGEGPRGLLYAVYDLLEALGCRWPAPGVSAAPVAGPLQLPADGLADRPATPRRGLIIGHDQFLAEAEPWIVWAARNRLNTIFVHTTIDEPALGAARLKQWRVRRRALLPLMCERAMAVEIGGHHLRDLLPRRLFRVAPELFRHDGVHRTPDHNLCVSEPRALALIARNAAAFYRAYPEADCYHLWPDDLRAGGWCHCERCVALSPSDQALIAVNALAAALPPERSTARVAYLAYHDTEEPPTLAPHPAVLPLFAPRLRSYAEGMDGPANAATLARLARCAAHFANPPALFEYYLDGILFKSSPPPLIDVLAADARAYRAAGVAASHVLLTGDRPYLHASPNAALFAHLAWAPAADPAALLADYAAARVGPRAAPTLALAYRALEQAWAPALARDPEAHSPLDRPRGRDPVASPPADVLDTFAEAPVAAQRRLEAMRRVDDALAHGRAAWDQLGPLASSLAAERAEWERAAALLRFLRLRHQLYVLVARDAPPARVAEALREAQTALDVLAAWEQRYVPPRAQANHRLLRAAFQLQLDHVADQTLSPLARLGLRARRARDLAWLLPRLLRLP